MRKLAKITLKHRKKKIVISKTEVKRTKTVEY